MSEQIDSLKEDEKAKLEAEYSEEESVEPRRHHHENNWLAGVVLIVVGSVFLLSNVTNFHLDNWWALFILIPAFGSFGSSWQAYQRHGRFSEAARGPFIGGLILLFVASVFLFNLNWGAVWPVFLIIGGLGALLNGLMR